jgi:predicted ATPase
VLTGDRGSYRLTSAFDSIQIPSRVQAVIAARIDRLAAADKQLLQVAAVIGKEVPYRVLAAIADTPEATMRSALADLQVSEFLYETSLFPDPEYTFKHALTHEVAYASLLHDKSSIHARVVACE